MKAILKILILSITTYIHSQLDTKNLIPNGDFELSNGLPFNQNQMDKCSNWSAFAGRTSDYYVGAGFTGFKGDCASGKISASSGGRLCGFGSCEGIVGQFPATLSENCPYRLSLRYSPKNNNEIYQLHLYLLSNLPADNALNPCETPIENGLKQLLEVIIPVNSTSTGSDNSCIWSTFSYDLIEIPAGINYIGIKGDNRVGAFYDSKYTYVDDIILQLIPYCQFNDCIDNVPISVTSNQQINPIPCGSLCNTTNCTFVNSGVSNEQPWWFTLNGAYKYRLQVYEFSGALVYDIEEESCCGFNNKVICWNGFGNVSPFIDLPVVSGGVESFAYQFGAWGCQSPNVSNPMCYLCPSSNGCTSIFEGAKMFYSGNITMFHGADDLNDQFCPYPYSDTCNIEFINCCTFNRYYEYIDFYENILISNPNSITFRNVDFNTEVEGNISSFSYIFLDKNTQLNTGTNLELQINKVCNESFASGKSDGFDNATI